MNVYRQGFTIIELLVVIGIIALLASFILASLSTTRDKARDAAIKSELVQLRSQAELYFAKNGSYGNGTGPSCTNPGTMFWDDLNIRALIVKINTDSGLTATCRAHVANKTWAVSAPLRTAPTLSWCVDSKGASEQIVGSTGHSC